MGEWGNEKLFELWDNENKMKKQIAEAKTKLLFEKMNIYYQVHQCPCCGTKSLLTFEYWEDINGIMPHKCIKDLSVTP